MSEFKRASDYLITQDPKSNQKIFDCPFLNEINPPTELPIVYECRAIVWGDSTSKEGQVKSKFRPIPNGEVEKCMSISESCPDRLARAS